MQKDVLCVLACDAEYAYFTRCLSSLCSDASCLSLVDELRIGLNCPTDELYSLAVLYAKAASFTVPVTLYVSHTNKMKYPMMRKMFFGPMWPISDDGRVIWFDCDSYVHNRPFFWAEVITEHDRPVVGNLYRRRWTAKQQAWSTTQQWFDKAIPYDNEPLFAQGSFWIASSRFLHRANYPPPELQHRGGDLLLGVMTRHLCGQRPGDLSNPSSVMFSADIGAEESDTAKPRTMVGVPSLLIAEAYDGTPLPTDHQNFSFFVERYELGKVVEGEQHDRS